MGPKVKRCDWSLSLKAVHSQITSLTVGDPQGKKMPKVQNSTNERKKDCSINLRQKKALHTGSDTTIPSFLAIVVFLVNLHWIF